MATDALPAQVAANTLLATLGSRLVRICYLVSASDGWYGAGEHGVHEVPQAVEITFDRGRRLLLSWEMGDDEEYLSVTSQDAFRRFKEELVSSVDVTDSAEWRELLGCHVTGVGISFHELADGAGEFVWAVRFELGSDKSFVVALGELDGEALKYMPDSLVVIFDRQESMSFGHLGSRSSAWGEALVVR